MPTYTVDVYEVHTCAYTVEAASKEEAVQIVKNGLAGQGYMEYSHTQKITACLEGEDPEIIEEN
jgi:hypothetical protein